MSHQQASAEFWDRLERRLAGIGDRAIRAYVGRSPRYQGEPPEHLYRHMGPNVRAFTRLFLDAARSGRDPEAGGEEATRPFRTRAQSRAVEGLPVEDLLDGYLTMTLVLWQDIAAVAEESGTAAPPEAVDLLLRCQRLAAHSAVQAHRREYQAAHTEEREAVRALVEALVAGGPAEEEAHRAGRQPASAYGVLALQPGEHPSERVPDAVGRRVAGRRKVLRLNEELHRAFGEEALAALDPAGGLVLLPSDPGGADRELAAARSALAALEAAAEVPVRAGYAHATSPEGVPAAATQARRLLRLPSAAPGQVAVMRELLLEYHLDQDTEARPALTALVDRLADHPELLTTLNAYFAEDFSRRRAAQRLFVHPNTVDNRLDRIAALTGADPRTSCGLMLLGAALALR
ncbi:PucR family transcriptional regulator [Phaeacidiphilus oryzae]|uniref:PucR family transcriptional regulator n=1 Tax=Phaeacidiphilus oryzae TaxID=348818 RepID=UPI00068D803B|nr:helix-turn-helix domain-containing protein [Phaeacidiphilus oryzae]